ncbi:MAG: polyprenyl synthetase family protein [Anaerolineae bacterium]|nr:polyprenyl synthetase family protein [Anaerolineae bacterium]
MDTQTPLQAVENLLRSVTHSTVPLLHETSQHILLAGGKRLRPRLTLLSFEAAGGTDYELVVPLAAAIEIIHTATLIHDDINDHGTLRRGRETINSRWGRTFALLTGDYLFTKTYQLMASYPVVINQILADAATELVEGETLQVKAAKEGTLDRETYLEIISKKTAALFVAASKLGAIAADAPPAWIDALSTFSFNLGLAFQIIDDVLDLIADSHQLGKNTGVDLKQARGIAIALQNGGSAAAAPAAVAVGVGNIDPERMVTETLLSAHSLDDAVRKGREKAQELVDLASASLNILPASAAVDALRDLMHLVITRDH